MPPLLFALILFAQARVVGASSGTVTGTLTTEAGKPAVGIRVAAMEQPDTSSLADTGIAWISVAETDSAGHYRLDSIPPGRYVITAGRAAVPIYFPGTADLAAARPVAMTTGATVGGIDFIVPNVSLRVVGTPSSEPEYFALGLSLLTRVVPGLTIPIQVRVDHGGSLPLSSANGPVMLRLERMADGFAKRQPLTAADITLTEPTELRVVVEGLPDGYTVKSVTYGAKDLSNGTLNLTAQDIAQTPKATGGPPLSSPTISTATNGISITIRSSLNLFTDNRLTSILGTLQAVKSNENLVVELAASLPSKTGARVTGKVAQTFWAKVVDAVPSMDQLSVYLSGVPGVLYADGTFEFNGVPRGRHSVALLEDASSWHNTVTRSRSAYPEPVILAASVAVEDRDVDRVELREGLLLPKDFFEPANVALSANGSTERPGGFSPPASVRGRILDEASGQPVQQFSSVTLLGYTISTYDVAPNGEFQIANLLPGRYSLRGEVTGRLVSYRDFVIGEVNVNLGELLMK